MRKSDGSVPLPRCEFADCPLFPLFGNRVFDMKAEVEAWGEKKGYIENCKRKMANMKPKMVANKATALEIFKINDLS